MKLTVVDNLEIAPDDGISYSVESSVGSLRIPAGSSSATLSLTAYAYKKVGEAARTAYQCYFTVYKRTGATLTYATRGTTKDSSQSLNVGSVASTVDAVVVFITDNQLAANAAAPTAYLAKTEIVVNKDGNNGNNGGNTANIMLYKRSSSAVSEVGINATLYYKFSTKKLYSDAACTTEATSTNLNSWSLTIPSGTNDIYVTAAVAFSTSSSDDIAKTEWVTPVIYGKKGETGGHGINTATVFLYKRSSSAISAHGISNKLMYKFADGKLYTTSGTESTSDNRNGWSYSIPTGSDPCYVIQAAALSTGDFDEIETSEWSGVKRLVKDGDPGAQGYGIVAFLTRNNFTESQWSTYGTINHQETWTYQVVNADGSNNNVLTSAIRNGCRVGDFFTVSGTATDTGNTHRLIYVSTSASGSLSGKCVGHEITKAATGKTGKMCYIVGEYSADIEYTSNDKETVAVEIVSGSTSELWYLVASTNVVNGVHIAPTDSGQQVWEQGLNTYNLVRTKYLFADFAQLGSGIVSGDWLISKSGVIYINDEPQDYGPTSYYANKPAYLQFDPDYPDSDSGMDNFIPNYAIDLKTGKSYQQDAVLKGTIYASSGAIGGFAIGSTSLGTNGYTGTEKGYVYIKRDGLIKAYKATDASGNALDITGNISLVANNGQNIVLTTGGTGNIKINLSGNANSKLILVSPNMWKRTASTVGEVYIDSNNFLKVKVS